MDTTLPQRLQKSVSGSFHKTALLQKRVRELVRGQRPLFETRERNYIKIASEELERGLIELVADRLWLVRDGRVEPYEDDMAAYRRLLLGHAEPKPKVKKEKPAEAPKQRRNLSRDEKKALQPLARSWSRIIAKLCNTLKAASFKTSPSRKPASWAFR